jgi:small-conductance mechanosensitive channel
MNLFEKATKNKYRFKTQQGALYSVEDLWDLALQHATKPCLDNIAIGLSRQIKALEEESFVAKKTSGETELSDQLEIVRHIIAVKQQEQEAKETAAKVRAQNQRIREILAQKEDADLLNKSAEELRALLQQ